MVVPRVWAGTATSHRVRVTQAHDSLGNVVSPGVDLRPVPIVPVMAAQRSKQQTLSQ